MSIQQMPNEAPAESAEPAAVAEQFSTPAVPAPAPATRPLPPPEGVPARWRSSADVPPRQMAPPRIGPHPYPPGTGYGMPVSPPKRHRVPWYAWLIGAILAGILMLSLLAALALGLFVGFVRVATGPQVTSTSTFTFTVTELPRLVVKNNAGNVTVGTGPNEQVTIEVTKRARDVSQNEAQNDLNRFQISLTQTGNTVNAIATGDWHTSLAQDLSADLSITVPAATNLDLTMQAGDITITNVRGGLTATLTAGTLTTTGMTLNAVSHITVTAGEANIAASLTTGTPLEVDVTTGTARLMLPAATAAHLDARVRVGDISVTGWPISVAHQGTGATANGDLNANPTGTLTIEVTTGSIQLSVE